VESSEIEFPKEKVAFDNIVFDRKFLADNEADIRSLIRSQFKEVKLDTSSDVQMPEVTLGEQDIGPENAKNEEPESGGCENHNNDKNEVLENGRSGDSRSSEKATAYSVTVAQTILPLRETVLRGLKEYMDQEEDREKAMGNLKKALEDEKAVTTKYAKIIQDQKAAIEAQNSKLEKQSQKVSKMRGKLRKARQNLDDSDDSD
jgi:hypothetical protein